MHLFLVNLWICYSNEGHLANSHWHAFGKYESRPNTFRILLVFQHLKNKTPNPFTKQDISIYKYSTPIAFTKQDNKGVGVPSNAVCDVAGGCVSVIFTAV